MSKGIDKLYPYDGKKIRADLVKYANGPCIALVYSAVVATGPIFGEWMIHRGTLSDSASSNIAFPFSLTAGRCLEIEQIANEQSVSDSVVTLAHSLPQVTVRHYSVQQGR